MKKLLAFIGICLFAGLIKPINAQNWNLFQQNEHYHFQHSGDTIPLYTLFIDSVRVLNGDSIFYLNRFFLPCDTCQVPGYFLDNQPGFLQREWVKMGAELQVLQNPETYFVQVTGTVGDEWWFDANQTLKAKILSKNVEPVFGDSDSVLTIAIDNEAQIKLSKKYGLLKYFDYSLSGLEYEGLGKCLPGFKEFYDFQVGDIFQYRVTSYNFVHPYDGGIYKFKILDIDKKADTIDVLFDEMLYPNFAECEHYQNVERYVNYKNHFSNTYPFQKIPVYSYALFDTISNIPDWYDAYTYTEVIPGKSSVIKDIGYAFIDSSNKGPFIESIPGLFYVTNSFNYIPSVWHCRYQVGLGQTLVEVNQDGDQYLKELIGYIKNGDTTGIVYSDEYMMGVNDFKEKADINCFPNPSNGSITVNFSASQTGEIDVYSIFGVKLFEKKVFDTKEMQIDLSNYKGVFWVIFTNQNHETKTQKIIIQ